MQRLSKEVFMNIIKQVLDVISYMCILADIFHWCKDIVKNYREKMHLSQQK